jgi:hypothetical protein
MSIFLTFWVLAVALAAAVVIFYIWPAGGTSLLRYRLWPLRDELVDAIRNGEFEDDDQPKRLVGVIEATIETADELRPLRMIILMALLRKRRAAGEDLAFDLSEARLPDKARLQGMHRRFISSVVRHLLFGSPSALVFAVVALPTFAVITLMKGRSSDDGETPHGDVVDNLKEALRNEIQVEPAVRILAQWPGTPKGAAV